MQGLMEVRKIIAYIENNLYNDIDIDDVASHIHSSKYHVQRVFSIATGFSIGEYIRNRRLSIAAQEILNSDIKIVDVALKYMYESPESFTKAFSRLYRYAPSHIRTDGIIPEVFHPLSINIELQGGFRMNKIEELKKLLSGQYAGYLQEIHDYAVKKGLTLHYRMQDPPNPPRNQYLYHYNEYFRDDVFFLATRVFVSKNDPNIGQFAVGIPLQSDLERLLEEVKRLPDGGKLFSFCKDTMTSCDQDCMISHGGYLCIDKGRFIKTEGFTRIDEAGQKKPYYVCSVNAYVGKLYHTPKATYTEEEIAMVKQLLDMKLRLNP